MRRYLAFIALFALSLSSGSVLSAKEFRNYFGMQWVVTPDGSLADEVVVSKGDFITRAKLLTEDLYSVSSSLNDGKKQIASVGLQFATAVSARNIRCSLGRGEKGTISYRRRICVLDDDGDGKFESYFDIGLGQGGGDVQLTGCIPTNPNSLDAPIEMKQIPPSEQIAPMEFRVQLKNIHSRRSDNPTFTVGGSIGRNDRIWNYYSFCRFNDCRISLNEIVGVKKYEIAFRITDFDGEKATVSILQNFQPINYWDMSRGNRPDGLYCPGTLFVKTDRESF